MTQVILICFEELCKHIKSSKNLISYGSVTHGHNCCVIKDSYFCLSLVSTVVGPLICSGHLFP